MFDITRLHDGDPDEVNIERITEQLQDAIGEMDLEEYSTSDLAYALASVLLDGPEGKGTPEWDTFVTIALAEVMMHNRIEQEKVTLQ